MNSDHSFSQWLGNAVSGGALVATWIGWLPTIMTMVASSVALIWYLIQIHESETVQRWIATRRLRKLARMKAQVLLLEAQMKAPLPGPASGGAALH